VGSSKTKSRLDKSVQNLEDLGIQLFVEETVLQLMDKSKEEIKQLKAEASHNGTNTPIFGTLIANIRESKRRNAEIDSFNETWKDESKKSIQHAVTETTSKSEDQ
jgi:hypothetical protein